MKKVIAFLLFLILLFSLAACGGDVSDNAKEPNTPVQTFESAVSVGQEESSKEKVDFTSVYVYPRTFRYSDTYVAAK